MTLQDVGQSILESYSRVLESLAFTILSRIDDVLHVDDHYKCQKYGILARNSSLHQSSTTNHDNGKAYSYLGLSKSASIHSTRCGSPPRSFHGKSLSDYMGWAHILKGDQAKQMIENRNCSESPGGHHRQWSHSGNFNVLRSPPSRD